MNKAKITKIIEEFKNIKVGEMLDEEFRGELTRLNFVLSDLLSLIKGRKPILLKEEYKTI